MHRAGDGSTRVVTTGCPLVLLKALGITGMLPHRVGLGRKLAFLCIGLLSGTVSAGGWGIFIFP